MEGLLLLQTANEDLEKLFEGRHRQIFSTVVVDCHLFDFAVFLY